MPYSPQLNTGLPGLNMPSTPPPFNLYSDKKIVSSSMPVRERISAMNIEADELEREISNFEQKSQNNVVLNYLKNIKY